MTVIPSLSYTEILHALERAGWQVSRQRGSHLRLTRFAEGRLKKLTIPAHRPVKRTTLAKIIKQADLTLEEFLGLL
ncbi:MAG: type II toxin-antitoxin system HicA family toxin [Deltaproteobacteria bacterium]|nr:type II toxin-antitoxin system HicA family toxin [Deltaproteobacteria bacterium]